MATSAAQLKQLTADLAARDREAAALREEVEATRRRLHALQVGGKGPREGRRCMESTTGAAAPCVHFVVWEGQLTPEIAMLAAAVCRSRRPRLPPKTWWR